TEDTETRRMDPIREIGAIVVNQNYQRRCDLCDPWGKVGLWIDKGEGRTTKHTKYTKGRRPAVRPRIVLGLPPVKFRGWNDIRLKAQPGGRICTGDKPRTSRAFPICDSGITSG